MTEREEMSNPIGALPEGAKQLHRHERGVGAAVGEIQTLTPGAPQALSRLPRYGGGFAEQGS